MKTTALLVTLLVMSFLSHSQTVVNISGPNSVSPGQTATYTSSAPSGYYTIWNVTYGTGTVNGTANSYFIGNGNSISVQWGTPNCGNPATSYVTFNAYSSWPPTGSALYTGSETVTIGAPTCPPRLCSDVKSAVDGVWYNTSIPQNNKCSVITSVITSYRNAGYTDFSCVDWHGCPH